MRIRMFVTNVVFVETIDQFVVLTGCQGPVFQVPPTSLMPPNVSHYTKCPLTTLN